MLDASSVEITLDGEQKTLTCTVEGVIVMSKAYGGMGVLYNRCKDLDIEAMAVAIRAGLMVDGKEAEELLGKIYKSGLIKIQPQVCEFVLLAASGGVRQDGDDDGEDEAPGKD